VIASVAGRVAAVAPDGAIVEVGGVGLQVQCSPGTLAQLRVGEQARLATSLVVREDSLTLYGFVDDEERLLFELLQTASGVGPRLAQAVLAVHSPTAVRRAVATEDLTALTRVPGVGRKGAQRMVLELRDRVGSVDSVDLTATAAAGWTDAGPATPSWRSQLHGALTGLGWSGREADEAVSALTPAAEAQQADGRTPEIAVLLRSALQLLGPAR